MRNEKYITEYCTGCGLCHSVKDIPFIHDKKGFPVPVIKDDLEDNFFKDVCPIYAYQGKCYTGIWGEYKNVYVGYSSDEAIRYKASTGGALTEISIYLLEAGLVDGIIHTTVDADYPTKAKSCVSATKEEVINRCGSRYSISVPLMNIMAFLKKGKKYAFIGKPCDVMALRNYFVINPMIEQQISYLLSFFCAGEPSIDAQKKLLAKMECNEAECISLNYRGNGWPGFTTAIDKKGRVYRLAYNIAWGQYLGRDIRKICRFCMDGTGDAADIVCADFWQLDINGKPDFSEHDGRNAIITRTDKGEELFKSIIHSAKIKIEDIFTNKMDEFKLYQPHQFRRKSTMDIMLFAMRLFGKRIPIYGKSYLKTYASYSSKEEKKQVFIGTVKRIIKRRI